MTSRAFGFRVEAIRARVSRRTLGRTSLFAFIAAFVLVGGPTGALALEEGEYVMQCSCPVWWTGDWDGNGVFKEDDSLDIIALANGPAVFLMHELPVDAMDLDEYAEARSESLEDNRDLEDVEIVWDDESTDRIDIGRAWVNAEGDVMLSWQAVLVWETNYLLSIEFIAPEDDFEDAWNDSLPDVALVGVPVTMLANADDIMEEFGL